MANPTGSGGCTPQRTLIRFATLLGTFSLEDKKVGLPKNGEVGDGNSSSASEHDTSCAIQSGRALRELLTPQQDTEHGGGGSTTSISSFPSLSLDSAAHHDHPESEPRSKVEGLASSNLARPIIVVAREHSHDGRPVGGAAANGMPTAAAAIIGDGVTVIADDDHPNGGVSFRSGDETTPSSRQLFPITDVALIPSLLLTNLSASFALLVDARLRAYGTILARHAASLVQEAGGAGGAASAEEEPTSSGGDGGGDASEQDENSSVGSTTSGCIAATERKLSALIEIGEDVRMDGVVTALRVHSTAEAEEASGGVGGGDDHDGRRREVVSMPLVFEAVVDVSVPNLVEGGRDKMTVSMKAPGAIAGYFDEGSDHTHLRSVHVQLDTHALLSSMIDQACAVVFRAVENVNASSRHQAKEAALASSLPTAAELLASDDGGDERRGDIPAEVGEAGSSMPPPEPRAPPPPSAPAPTTAEGGLGLRCAAGPPVRYPIVSPRLYSVEPSGDGAHHPTPLTLQGGGGIEKSKRRRTSLTLTSGSKPESAEKCAAIVDYVMGEVDEASWICPSLASSGGGGSSSSKRAKTAAASAAVYPLSA